MKAGKLSEAVLKRSVLRYVKEQNKNEVQPAVGMDAGVFMLPAGRTALSMQTVTGEGERTAQLALLRAVNSLAAAGARAEQATLAVTLPECAGEEELKQLMQQVQDFCEPQGITVAAGHTAVSRAVLEPAVSVTALGAVAADAAQNKKWEPQDAGIVMTKWCAVCGTALLAEHYEELLCTRYTKGFIEGAKALYGQIFAGEEAELALKSGAEYVHDAAEGGIFGALWELSQALGCGMEVDIRKIPIKQETVEICEYFDCNPYQLRAEGSLLIVSRQPEKLCRTLQAAGIPSATIGILTKGKDCRLLNEDEVRYLEPNRVEEYERVRSEWK